MEEIFKLHKSGYFISNKGRIKGIKVEYLSLAKSNAGYLVTGLPSEKGYSWYLVHRAVYETFVGEIPKDMVINHIDGNKLNNYITNLELVTYSQNMIYAFEIGLIFGKAGETNSQAKLTNEEFLQVCQLLMEGATNEEIGNLFNLNDRYVSLIRHKRRWKNMFPDWYSSSKSLGATGIPLPSMIKIYTDCLNKSLRNMDIAEKYKLDRSTISRIRNNLTWKDFIQYYNNSIATTN
jgi:hypothetical protein